MRRFILVLAAVFAATLATVVGFRSSMGWGPFLFGVLCGIIASVPASFLALYLARGTEPQPPTDDAAYAPLVIVNTPSVPQDSRSPVLPPIVHSEAAAQAPRYRIVGGD